MGAARREHDMWKGTISRMGSKAVIGTISCVLASSISTVAAAHDLLPPPFRGKPGSTHQSWEFSTPNLGFPDGPCPVQNSAGIPFASGSPGLVWLPQFAGEFGVWCLVNPGESLNFDEPNPGGNPWDLKTIWVQMTLHFHSSTSDVTVSCPGAVVTGSVDLPVPGKGPAWVHRTVALCLFNCPPFETITITSKGNPPFDHVDVGQVVIETYCEPDMCYDPPLPVFPGDFDGDGIGDQWDNAPGIFNPNQSDCDGDGLGDPSDLCEICPPGTPGKGEPCGSDLNGGCNTPADAVTVINCNEEICGDAWAEAGVRDTDWFVVKLTDDDGDGKEDLNVQVCTAIPLTLWVLDDVCPPSITYTFLEARLDQQIDVTLCLPAPAKYRIVLAPGSLAGPIFDGYPCNGLYNQYWLRVWCAEPCLTCGVGPNDCCKATQVNAPGCDDFECCATVCVIDPFCCNVRWDQACANEARSLCSDICCTADLNGDGIVNGSDLGDLLGYWGATFINPADLNGDCFVDGADLGELLGQWGPC